MGSSPKSWDEAAENAVRTASKTINNITGVEVEHMTAKVEGGEIVSYKTTVKIVDFGVSKHDLADEACLEFRLRPGDMQFVNNHVIYHARTAYRDAAEAGGRLLHRLWLSMPNSRALPPDQAVLWGNVGAGQLRGGIGQD